MKIIKLPGESKRQRWEHLLELYLRPTVYWGRREFRRISWLFSRFGRIHFHYHLQLFIYGECDNKTGKFMTEGEREMDRAVDQKLQKHSLDKLQQRCELVCCKASPVLVVVTQRNFASEREDKISHLLIPSFLTTYQPWSWFWKTFFFSASTTSSNNNNAPPSKACQYECASQPVWKWPALRTDANAIWMRESFSPQFWLFWKIMYEDGGVFWIRNTKIEK